MNSITYQRFDKIEAPKNLENLSLEKCYYRIDDETKFVDQKTKKTEKMEKRKMVFNSELMEKVEELILSPIQNHQRYKIRPARGILLHGQSGLGKRQVSAIRRF